MEKITDNPLVSFCLFTYNQEKYILDALNGAINQNYDNMEIIVSDDCSSDNTFQIIQDFFENYKGKHQIKLNKNKTNLGIRNHFNKLIYDIAKGDIIIVAADDDVSLPERTKVTVDFFKLNPQVKSLHFKSIQVDENLKILPNKNILISEGLNSIITLDDYLNSNIWLYSGDSRAFTREIINKFPKLEICRNEDMPTFIRAIILGATAYIRQGLVLRRIDGNNTSLQWRFKQEGKDLQKQLFNDIEYALKQGYIDNICYESLKKKILNVIVEMKFYDLERLLPPIMFLYRIFIAFPRFIAKKI